MPRFSVFIATSLDGYIARADGGTEWLEIVEQPGEDYGFAAFFGTIDTLVVGRGTYDAALRFGTWPYQNKRVIVMTHHAITPRHDEVFFGGPPGELVRKLSDAKRVYVDGGHVIRQFMAAELIDDLVVSVIPIVLGDGIRLFAGGEGEHRLELVGHRGWPSGLVQLSYRRVPRAG
jgi:dihydrofolate reductase